MRMPYGLSLVDGGASDRCRHGHSGPCIDDRPATLDLRENRLIARIGRALHLPAAASPGIVADLIRVTRR
ncbi:hypothetical protein EDD40_0993 [Saccharothrix texasensis]|uniref:Uncharacterized protein n=1 Tax=Saccharothrix texasensis TaxID=103734 RepID=A0A3N1H0G3_9PSEU|nr:hypothetical protein EDD40_0993 [Saccharothrix texasensis]